MRGSSITLEDYTLEEVVRIFRDNGFDRVEMWKHQLKRCKTNELRQKFATYAKGMGISMGGLNAVGEDYFQPFGTDQQLQATLDGLKGDMEFALSLGTTDVLIWEGRAPQGSTESEWVERLLPRLVELFQAAISFAAPKGVRFMVEPHPFTVGMSDRLLVKLCDKLDSAHFGVTYDFCHYGVGRPKDYVTAVHALGPRIRHIHFSDSDQESSELHFPPGQGRMDLHSLLNAFKNIGYDGTMALDLYGYPLPEQALPDAVSQMREACELLGLRG
jgi:sugar phosphate isomerase/epimerase